MKIAIIGAGLAGLSCAITLEKHGLEVDVFEKRGMSGDRFMNAEAMFSMTQHPVTDGVKFLSETYGIHLKPSSSIQRLQNYSKNEKSQLDGQLGFIFMRGKHPESLESQLVSQWKGQIQYRQDVSYDDIAKEYTHVVIATGDARDTKKLQPYDVAFKATFRGAVVEGDFDQTEAHAFFNNDFAPKGMAYLLPHSDSKASLVLVYPQYHENERLDKEELWEMCYQECCRRLDQDLKIISNFSLKDYMIGKAEHSRIGNTFFIGNCWGAITPAFGFGQFESMLTGIYAAEDIAGKGDYEELTKHLSQGYHDSLTLRRGLEKLDNQKLDLLTKSISNKFAEELITSKNINLFKIIGRALHPFSRKA
ncbi:NAD(P)/FAD-dependent oxidoreductase [Halobacillus litoralis]|uniref:FAD-dependent oxidoreductase n=1 Tax=Halobacillus litoralis TaxID=45668 RepID=UPI001CD4319D|nr:NAD(P)/FAD-dependent oxidoreductase [Halobacillus litoralis]MCA0970452.1 NAD(P)/FAD-dependent oxidoreductase [Halobacillus litoralis]